MKFGDILKGAAAEGKEKHVPVIERNGNDVTVTVGKETPHPSTMEHHIDWIELFGVTKDDKVIDLGRAYFAPTYTTPTARFTIPADGFKALYSVSYCNIHGVWESSLEL
jgi:superoxide reductase